ncbi:hypothetical protein JYB64_10645 [Algoriphagus aestuarii]|nr:hypothetical protein [Algoriphagus aestuarii]
MANSSQNLDKVFKEKLDQHSIKPSALAWERLESKLPKEPKSNKGFWWAAAASVVIVLSAGYFLYPVESTDPTGDMMATTQEITQQEDNSAQNSELSKEVIAGETLAETENNLPEENKTTPAPTQENSKTATKTNKPSAPQPKVTEAPNQNLIAMTETREEEKVITETITIEEKTETVLTVEPEITPPAMDLTQAIAENTPETEVEQPAYRVRIFSDGLKEEPKDKNLIAEIGKTVNEVGGLLGKVDQGLADLQDAKNNLFTNMTSKRERAEK